MRKIENKVHKIWFFLPMVLSLQSLLSVIRSSTSSNLSENLAQNS